MKKGGDEKMGDRISISFVNGEEESVTLFNHWGGKEFLKITQEYVRELKEKLKERNTPDVYPIDRLEPNTVMVDFIRWFTKDEKLIECDLHLGRDETEGDNSDNGHFKIHLDTNMVT